MDLGELIIASIEAGDLETLIWAYVRIEEEFLECIYTLAGKNGHLHILKWLLSLPFNDNINRNEDSWGVFEETAMNDHLHICKWLISLPGKKYNISIYFDEKFIKEGKLDICKMLFDVLSPEDICFAEMEYADEDGHLLLPLEKGYLDLCKWLLSLPEEYGVNITGNYNNAFRYALSKGYYDICDLIFKHPRKFKHTLSFEDIMDIHDYGKPLMAKYEDTSREEFLLEMVLEDWNYGLFDKYLKSYCKKYTGKRAYKKLLWLAGKDQDWELCRWLLEEHRDKFF